MIDKSWDESCHFLLFFSLEQILFLPPSLPSKRVGWKLVNPRMNESFMDSESELISSGE